MLFFQMFDLAQLAVFATFATFLYVVLAYLDRRAKQLLVEAAVKRVQQS